MPVVYLNTVQAGEKLGITGRQVAMHCAAGHLGQRIGRNWAITEAQLERFAMKPRPRGRKKKRKARSRLPSNL